MQENTAEAEEKRKWQLGMLLFYKGDQEKPYWEGDVQAEIPDKGERVSCVEVRMKNTLGRGKGRPCNGNVPAMFKEEQSGYEALAEWEKEMKSGRWGQATSRTTGVEGHKQAAPGFGTRAIVCQLSNPLQGKW